jgi:ribosomal protein S18 acetylase RimI-like enzyme
MSGAVEMSAPLPAIPSGPWPGGTILATWRDADAPDVHALLVEAYRDGGGSALPYDRWLTWFTTDDEFDATTCFLARDGAGRLAGVCLCWSSGFVKDVCVAPHARRRGLGSALIGHAAHIFARRGLRDLRLKVEPRNAEAIRLYERLGFRRTG